MSRSPEGSPASREFPLIAYAALGVVVAAGALWSIGSIYLLVRRLNYYASGLYFETPDGQEFWIRTFVIPPLIWGALATLGTVILAWEAVRRIRRESSERRGSAGASFGVAVFVTSIVSLAILAVGSFILNALTWAL